MTNKPDTLPEGRGDLGAGAIDVVTMTDDQCLVLDRMSDELGYPFRDIASDCGIAERSCRRIVQHFHAMCMTGFGPLYSDEDSRIMGKGYWLRKPGWEAQDQVRRAMGARLYAMAASRQSLLNQEKPK